jgi:hypothetical protein
LPSPVIRLFAGTVAASTPDRPSVARQATVTSPEYQPAAFGLVVGRADEVRRGQVDS